MDRHASWGQVGVWEANTPSLASAYSRPRVDLPASAASAQARYIFFFFFFSSSETVYLNRAMFINQLGHQPASSSKVGKIPATERMENYKLILAVPILSE